MNRQSVEALYRDARRDRVTGYGLMVRGLDLVHRSVEVPAEKRKKLRELENTTFKLSKLRTEQKQSQAIEIDPAIALYERHKVEVSEVYAAIGRGGWFDDLHSLVPSGKVRVLGDIAQRLDGLKQAQQQGNTHVVGFNESTYALVCKFNELAIALHLGKEHFNRYSQERDAVLLQLAELIQRRQH
ncbi:MAG: hypothetical protein Q8R15_03090 [Candidatus Micrarchaeota archaeon]|nr:hypothetical protein [Candidatus Micrarchaeota archaeon]